MLAWLQTLPLAAMFLATLAISLLCCWAVVAGTRVFMARIGWGGTEALPIRDSIAGGLTGIFALIIVFSAAGIWNETVSARGALHREADALENALALLRGLPEDTRAPIADAIRDYAARVVDTDWPAMRRGASLDDPAYLPAEAILIGLIGDLSARQAALTGVYSTLMTQFLEARHARLQRVTLAHGGLSAAQWTAMLIVALAAMAAFAACNNNSFSLQLVVTHLFALAAAAVFFLVLAHDRPFVGSISVQPTPIAALAR